MKRAAGFLVFLLLVGGAVRIGLNSRSEQLPAYALWEHGSRPIGLLTVRPGNELCWELALDTLPKALQLHHDVAGPSDPVVVSFYEPPTKPRKDGCIALPREHASQLASTGESFYVDGHDRDAGPPAMWAELVER